MRDQKEKIVICGGGPAGIAAARFIIEMLVKGNNAADVVICEQGEALGMGTPYQATCDWHQLNSLARLTSLNLENPREFVEWLESHRDVWQATFSDTNINADYLPRGLFGLYLKAKVEKLKTLPGVGPDKKVTLTIMTQTQVVGLTKSQEIIGPCQPKDRISIKLFTEGHGHFSISADQVVLSLGHLQHTKHPHLLPSASFIANPFPLTGLIEHLKTKPSVSILGTGLTSIDIILGLVRAGYNGQITAVSRSGRLPAVAGPKEKYIREYLTQEAINRLTREGKRKITLRELLGLFKKELEKALDRLDKPITKAEIKDFASPVSAKQWLDEQIAEANKGLRLWQSMLCSLTNIVPNIWQALDEPGKRDFLEKYYSTWIACVAAFPITNAERILGLINKGQLVFKGGVQSVRLLLANKSITIKFKDQENCPDLTPKVLVDATGPTDKLESLVKKHPVLANPMIISAHPLGGIDVNFQTMQVRNSQQEPQTRVFAIGKITCGRFLSTSNLHQTLRQAERAALTVWENVQLSQQGEEKRLATGSNKRPSAVAEATDEQKTKKARLITSEPSSNLTKPEPGGACSRPLLRRYASSPANAAGQSLGMFPKLPSLEQKQETSRAIPQAASQTASQATSQESYFSAPRKERRKSPAEPASQGSYFSYS